ncbi:homocysteine S-methyltransferase YbgG [Trichomycterus rosablanca]|uniref:homocysteine S-methyltransferase YbgG n=1 Tax=Trichomycterus rosablanca TaxID=2290929 RepID=UPI002F35ABC2
MDCLPFILDGGLATELEERGFQLQGDPLWSAKILHTNPNTIKDVHYSYLQSGSDVITTATYQASIEGFTKHLGVKPEEAETLLRSGVQLAKEAAAEFMSSCATPDRRRPLVAGSVGPYGAFLHDGSEYTGNYACKMSVQELKDWHRPQVGSLVAAGADLLALETIPSLKEAEALVELLREFPDTKAWLSFTCKDAQSISDGNKFLSAVEVASKSTQLVAVGVNCSPPALVKPLLESARSHKAASMSWVVYPNSGEGWDPSTGWIKEKRTSFTELSAEWKEQGALWIGGCCRIGPADIAQLRSQLMKTQTS